MAVPSSLGIPCRQSGDILEREVEAAGGIAHQCQVAGIGPGQALRNLPVRPGDAIGDTGGVLQVRSAPVDDVDPSVVTRPADVTWSPVADAGRLPAAGRVCRNRWRIDAAGG
jgi:hypothetical protein